MPGAYWIAHVTVSDEEAYMKYAALATQAITAHGGTFLARGGQAIQKEGRAHPRCEKHRDPRTEKPFTGEHDRIGAFVRWRRRVTGRTH